MKLTKLSRTFALYLSPPNYFKDVHYTIWQYIGTGEPTLEGKMDALYSQLTQGS